MKPHPHSELIKAWADGAEIQIKFYDGWRDCRPIDWNPNSEYRIKPEPKPDVIQFCNLKLTFDGETGELKSAEVLK